MTPADHPAFTHRLSPRELAERLAARDVSVIDVREPMEYASGHIAGSLNVPLAAISEASLPPGPLVMVCQSGNRSRRAQDQLQQRGHADPITDLEGGMSSWQQAGLPVRKPKGAPLPMMRQVQIAAGSLVLLGLLLSALVAPAWILLSWFVGAGLVFSGLTGSCAMARLLALMPWNQARG